MPLKTTTDEPMRLDLTPLVDIVFLLVIFFLVGTQYSEMERQMEMQLPEINGAESLTNRPSGLVVALDSDGNVSLDDAPMESIGDLAKRLKWEHYANAGLDVQFRYDADARGEDITRVMHACKTAGFNGVDLAMIPTNESY